MDIAGVLRRLLDILGSSPDYFVSGSLSFLPLVPRYREPRHDVDVGVAAELFEARRAAFEAAGEVHVLRLSEVAIADAASATRLLAPRTGFVHVETPDGLIDLSQFARREGCLELFLGAGLTLRVPGAVLERVRVLEWEGLRYRAGPPELALLPKILWYLAWKDGGAAPSPEEQKHLLDLRHAHALVDWQFAGALVAEAHFCWRGRRFPAFLDRLLNPFRTLEPARARDEVERLAARPPP